MLAYADLVRECTMDRLSDARKAELCDLHYSDAGQKAMKAAFQQWIHPELDRMREWGLEWRENAILCPESFCRPDMCPLNKTVFIQFYNLILAAQDELKDRKFPWTISMAVDDLVRDFLVTTNREEMLPEDFAQLPTYNQILTQNPQIGRGRNLFILIVN